MQSYFLDLATLLQILSRQKQSGVLQAEDVRLAGIKQAAQAELTLVEGQVSTLYLKMGNSILAQGSQALQMLYEVGPLEWSWTVNPSWRVQTTARLPAVSVGNPSPREERLVIPRRTSAGEMAALEILPRNHRRAFALIDGRRSINQIASMLAFTDHEKLRKLLRDLQAWGMIIWDESPLEQQ